MKKLKTLYAITCFAMLSNVGICQNLVQNPSFEDFISCPTTAGQITLAINWKSYGIDPDYYNSCSSSNFASIPNNYLGYQLPSIGNAYMGFHPYERILSQPLSNTEVIGQQLLSPLVIGQKYFASFKANLPRKDTSLINLDNCVYYACNKLGMLFSTISYSDTNPAPINNFAQIYSDSIIMDTLNWVMIRGSFIADQAYSNLSIGVFFANNLIDTVKIYKSDPSACEGLAYYFIDDVALSTDSLIGLQIVGNHEIQKNIENFSIIQTENQLAIKLLNNSIENEFLIFDNIGNIIFQNKNKLEQLEIDLSEFKSGVYYLNILNDQNILKHKILISKQ